MQDISTGDPAFDRAFVVKSNDPARAERMVAMLEMVCNLAGVSEVYQK